MGIKPRFKQADVRKRLDQFMGVIQNRIISRMQYLGEMCVTHARQVPAETGFRDQTGNLRSSIGYMVFHNGKSLSENYKQVAGGTLGIERGKALAREVAGKFPKGFLLVVTAGMDYAIHLESKGRDVLASAENLAEREWPRMREELTRNVAKAMQKVR